MNRLAILLALVAGCSGSGGADAATDGNRNPGTRWEACEGCVIGCDVSGVVRCVPYAVDAVGCDRCVAWCGNPHSDRITRAFCEPTPEGLPGAFCEERDLPEIHYPIDGIGSCYLDRWEL